MVSRSAHMLPSTASVYLMVGAFNPFTFKIIIDMYDPITVFLTVWGLSSLCKIFPCFLFREVLLAFVVKLVWWC